MNSRIAGKLSPLQYDDDSFESQPIEIPYFDNTTLKVEFIEPEYEPYLKEADEVLERFLSLNQAIRLEDSKMVYNYYAETLQHGHCQKLTFNSISEIWNHVTPKQILIDWEDHGRFFLQVSCGCTWEKEHGLQLIFKNGERLTRASGHDGHYED